MGAAYSGSSVLNLIMDTQPKIRGLGETIHHIQNPNAWCTACGGELGHCELRPKIDYNRIHDAFFKHYPEDDVMFDTSKSWPHCFTQQRTDAEIKIVLLSKRPHEFAWNWWQHTLKEDPDTPAREGFAMWVRFYRNLMNALDHHCGVTKHRGVEVGQDIYPLLLPSNIHFVTYQDMVNDTSGTVSGICHFLGTPFDESKINDWFDTSDTCSVGGNNAAFAQRTKNQLFFTDSKDNPQADYLDGKYHGQYQKIFMDTAWQGNSGFYNVALHQYKQLKTPMARLLPILGHGSVEDCVAALKDPDNA
jgi:hypothetical protein